MKKNKRLFILLTLYFSISQIDAQTPLSFEESLHLLNQGNQSLKIADKSIEIAKAERDKLNAFWYPSLQSTGAFVHMSEKIEVKQPLSQFTDPAKDFVHSIIPDDQVISSILDQIGANTLVFPLTPRNLTTVDLSAEWVLFSGGKRSRATNIGRTMVDLARESRAQVSANQQNLLVESYYGLRLAQQIVTVREETYNGLKKHYENALKLEAAGMIDKAGRLFAQVNMDEAKRALEAARKEETVVQSALKVLLNKKDTDANIIPTSPLFMNDSLPPKMLFDLSVNSGNYTLDQLQLQQHIAKQEVRIAQSGYLPKIALFGKQTLYSHGIQSNLLPRTMIGIGFTWNLFNGLDREKKVRQSKLTEQTLALGQMKARDDLAVGVDKLYTQLEKAQDNVKALNATIALSEELVRIRKKSFTEGMATSTEVIDAETMLASVRVARLAAYYEYDVALINLLSLCGTPEQFANYQPKPQQIMKPTSKTLSWAFVIILLAVGIFTGLGVILMHKQQLVLQGQAEATEIRISGKLPGRIDTFFVQEGDWVHQGDTLVVINSPEVYAKYQQVNALEQVAVQQNKKIDAGTRRQIVATALQLWNKTKSDLTLAQTTYNRILTLYKDSVVTSQRKDEVEAMYKAAVAAERAAYEQYQMAVDGAQKEDKASAASMVDAARSTVDEVSALLVDSRLTAPENGQIATIFPKRGELVAPGTPIMNLVVMDDIHVVLNVREDLMPQFKMDGTFVADVPAIGKENIEFKIYYISPLGSFATWKSTKQTGSYDLRTFEIHARPTQKVDDLRPGMSVLLTLD